MKNNIIAVLAGVIVVIMAVVLLSPKTPASASVSQGGEYVATTTATYGTTYVTGVGAFGSVIITGPLAQPFSLYDASSTMATSTTNLIASFPASAPAGTYTFDARVLKGLEMSSAATQPTMTVTYRQY